MPGLHFHYPDKMMENEAAIEATPNSTAGNEQAKTGLSPLGEIGFPAVGANAKLRFSIAWGQY